MKRQSLAVPIARRSGRGWLVLIGGTSDTWRATEPIDRATIELMQRDAPIAFVPAAACPPDYGTSFLAVYGRPAARVGHRLDAPADGR